jgi:hypothetical protein
MQSNNKQQEFFILFTFNKMPQTLHGSIISNTQAVKTGTIETRKVEKT